MGVSLEDCREGVSPGGAPASATRPSDWWFLGGQGPLPVCPGTGGAAAGGLLRVFVRGVWG